MTDKDRMDHERICKECGSSFKGFKFQSVCWMCIHNFIGWYFK